MLVKKMLTLGVTEARVEGDSQLVIRQLKGEYSVKSKRIIPSTRRLRSFLQNSRQLRLSGYPEKKTRRQIESLG